MNVTDYFQIISTSENILYFEVKNYWSDEIINTMESQIFTLWKSAVDSYSGNKFVSMPDMTNFKVAQDKGKALIARMMKYAQEHNLYHSVQIMPEALARITISEPSGKVGHNQFRSIAKSLAEARQIAYQKLKEI